MHSVTIEAPTRAEAKARAVEEWDRLSAAGYVVFGGTVRGSTITLKYHDPADDEEGEE